MKRRTFLGNSLLAGGALLVGAPLLSQCARADRSPAPGSGPGKARPGSGTPSVTGPQSPAAPPVPATTAAAGESTVVVASHPDVLGAGTTVKAEAVRALLATALQRLTGQSDARAALRGLVHPGQRVGLKVNCLAGQGLSTHPELVAALTDLLGEAGVRSEDILVWDRTDRDLARAGFRLNREGPGVRTLGTNQDYEQEVVEAGAVGGCLSRLLTRECDVVFNLPVLKDHDLAGISGAMKSFYGAIHNPNKYHDDHCSPYVADLYSLPAVRGKVVLTVMDALRPQFHGGPAYVPESGWPMGGLLLATDPVALDATAWRLIEEQRKQHGLKTLTDEHRSPQGWLDQAVKLGLGHAGPQGVREVKA